MENSFKPMLHTWSLSVEFQVYFLLPILFIFLLYQKKILFCSIIFLISLFSVISSEIFIERPFVYFFPIFRLHEFFAGVLIFYYLHYINKNKLNFIYSYLGTAIILYSTFYLNKNSNFPGFNSLLPLIGIGMIILSEDKNNILLNNYFSQFFGKISYSFYLYHWPIIVIYKYYNLNISLSLINCISIFLITTFFSFLSYKYVELFFYKSRNLLAFKKYTLIFLIIFISILLVQNKKLDASTYEISFNKELNSRNTLLKKLKSEKKILNNSEIYIIGDSHAEDLYLALGYINDQELKNKSLNYISLNDSCLKYLGRKSYLKSLEIKIAEMMNMPGQNFCNRQIKNFLNKPKIANSNIIISNRWSKDTIKNIENLLKYLDKNNNIILASRKPAFFDIPSLIKIKNKNIDLINKLSFELKDKNAETINDMLKLISKKRNLKFLDIYNIICHREVKECTSIHDNNILFIDSDHYSIKGFEFYGTKISKTLKFYLK